MNNDTHGTAENNLGGMLQSALTSSKTPKAILVDGTIAHVNNAFTALCGDVVNQTCYSIFTANHADQLQWLLSSSSAESEKIILALNVGKAGGKSVLVQYEPINKNIAMLSLLTEFSSKRLADLDELTGLPNRRRAVMMLEIAIRRLQRHPELHFCVAFGDIDHFKNVNDTYGHDVGDNVLRHIGEIIQSGLRDNDWVARWGGEEFILFLDENDIATGIQPLDRIRRVIDESKIPKFPDLKLSMSFGIVSSEEVTNTFNKKVDIQTIINKSDTLLYDAKINGRNRIEWDKYESTIWVKDTIMEEINNNKIIPLIYPIVDFNKNVLAYKIFHNNGRDENSIIKLLQVADRLGIRDLVDYSLFKALDMDCLKSKEKNIIFPFSVKFWHKNKSEITDCFNDFSNLSSGIYDYQSFKEEELKTLQAASNGITLTHLERRHVPIDLLLSDSITNVVFRQTETLSSEFISDIKNKVNVFAFFFNPDSSKPYSATKKQINNIQKIGFDGYLLDEPLQP